MAFSRPPAAPGGGWDQTARAMQLVLQQAGIVRTASVENIPGAAGTIGLARFIGAEHGIGVQKRDQLPLYKSQTELDVMRALKRTLDPKGILNPGKVLPR